MSTIKIKIGDSASCRRSGARKSYYADLPVSVLVPLRIEVCRIERTLRFILYNRLTLSGLKVTLVPNASYRHTSLHATAGRQWQNIG
ncbi:MAG: hypothetical protein GY862_32825 [Gammaproteobacteria bacterium]|nr:hypothetical protein [Gammaproteobacteria bacterium]